MAIALPQLPYDLDALEPGMSRDTLEFHHGKHHKAYVDKTNELIAGTPVEHASLEEIVRYAKQTGNQKLLNQAGQAWNHNFLWPCLSPEGGGAPGGRLAQLIDRDLGGLDGFKEAFKAEGANHFASGWAWLVLKDGKLAVTSFHDGDTPILHGVTPLLVCDLWEHAYYLDYQNQRPKFLEAFVEKLANWDFAEQNLEEALRAPGAGAESGQGLAG